MTDKQRRSMRKNLARMRDQMGMGTGAYYNPEKDRRLPGKRRVKARKAQQRAERAS